MEQKQLDEVRARLDAIPNLPWRDKLDDLHPDHHLILDAAHRDVADVQPWCALVEEAAAFIACAPDDIRALLIAVDALQRIVSELEGDLLEERANISELRQALQSSDAEIGRLRRLFNVSD